MIAGAGYGKTSALEDALRNLPASLWVTCAGLRGDAVALVFRIIEGLRASRPGLTDVLADRLAATPRIDPLAVAHGLRSELERLLVEPLVLVFDETEEVAGSELAVGVLEVFLDTRRSGLHMVLAGRLELPLNARFVRSGELRELGMADLAFTPDECAQLLTVGWGRPPDVDELEIVMSSTEGWPLAVSLSSAVAPGARFVRRTRAVIFAFLAEAVVDGLPAGLRSRVLVSSVPRELSDLVIAALGLESGFVEAACAAGIPLRRVATDEGDAWSYHSLVREFLYERLCEERSEADRRRLHGLVADALETSGQGGEAVQHWLEAERWREVVRILDREGQRWLRMNPRSVGAWIERLPADARAEPVVLLLEGQLRAARGASEGAIVALRGAAATYRDRANALGNWLARSELAQLFFYSGEFDAILELADGWEAGLTKGGGVGAAATAWFAAWVLDALGRNEAASAIAQRLSADRPTATVFAASFGTPLRAFTDVASGCSSAALERLERAVSRLEFHGQLDLAIHPMGTIALIRAERGELDLSLDWWERTAVEAEGAYATDMAAYARRQRALLFARLSRITEASIELERAGPPGGATWRDAVAFTAEAVIASSRGHPTRALAAAEQALTTVSRAPVNFQVYAAIELAPVLAAAGWLPRAEQLLDDALSELERVFPGQRGIFPRARLLAAKALVAEAAGREQHAYEALLGAWDTAGDQIAHVIRGEWPQIQGLLWRALEDGLLDPDSAVDAVAVALRGTPGLLAFLDHTNAGVRRAAVAPALASGDPAALSRLRDLEADPDSVVAAAAAAARERLKQSAPPLKYELLGGFRVTRGRWPIDEGAWGRPIAARVVRFLLIHNQAFVAEDTLFEAFWPNRPSDSARRNLTVVTSLARQVLDTPGSRQSVIQVHERSYRLHLREADQFDVNEFETAAAAALGEKGPARARLLAHAEWLWTGEPATEDRYADWSTRWRERLESRYLQVLQALVELHTNAAALLPAVTVARKAVDLDPLNEEAHRTLIAAYARAGRTGHALRQYLECRSTLVRELGVEPSEETSRLHARILAGGSIQHDTLPIVR